MTEVEVVNMIDPVEAKILEILGLSVVPDMPDYGPNDAVSTDYTTPYPPVISDLKRLYDFVRSRKVITVLEFGSGYSTAVIAAALAENRDEFGHERAFLDLRRNNPFELHTVDVSADWLDVTMNRVRASDRSVVFPVHSSVSIGTFSDRVCHFYDNIPNICPDLIYLDGPMQHDVVGSIGGVDFRHNDRTVVAADLARMEWLLLPGTLIVVDGRTNNARFLKANFQRNWVYSHDLEGDVHIFELIEPPLGSLNQRQLDFCLGRRS